MIIRRNLSTVVIILATVYWSLLQIDDYYVIDEAAFPFAANGVSETGVPYFYNGNTRPNDLGIWHPPLYVYVLGGWIKVFGFGQFQVRMFGVLCTVLTCLLIYKTARLFPDRSQSPAILGMGFYATHYLVVQSSLIPDIDGTLQPLAITLTIYFVARILTTPGKITLKSHLMLTIGLGICFSTKLTTPLLLILPITFAYLYKTKSLIKTISLSFLQMTLGIFLFLSWWIPVSKFQNLDWKFPIQFTLQSLSSKSGNKGLLDRILDSIVMSPSVISWLGISTFGIALLIFYLVYRERNSEIKVYSLAMISFTLISWMVYNSITGSPFTFPKYWNVGLIGISICIGLLWPTLKINFEKSDKWRISLLIGSYVLTIFMIYEFFILSNLQLTQNINSLNPSSEATFITVGIFILGIVLMQRMTEQSTLPVILVMTVIGVLAANSGINSALSKVEFSTRYYFGESGQREVVEWIKTNSGVDTVLFSAKDIGLESGVPFFEDSQILAAVEINDIPKYLIKNGVNVIVIRNLYDYSPQVYPRQLEAAIQGFKQISNTEFGDFQIWERIND